MPRIRKTTVELLEDEIQHQQARIRFLEGRYEVTGSRSTDRSLRKHRLILWALERAANDMRRREVK